MNEPPKLVASNPDIEREREAARRADAIEMVEHKVCVCLANMLRVLRGAGRRYEVAAQMIEVVNSYRELQDRYGSLELPFPHLADLLPDRSSGDVDTCIPPIVRGALQVVASRLVGQRTQAATGENEIFQGIYVRERVLAELDARRPATSAAKKTPPSEPVKL